MDRILEKLINNGEITKENLLKVLSDSKYDEELILNADKVRRQYYGDKVYIRGLIEVSNYCKNDCYYCGIRASNSCVERYRLSKDEILSACQTGYGLGFRTFVMQGGEDGHFTDDTVCDIVSEIKKRFPEVAVTLSLGERSYESYKRMYDAGADRYLLRHEAASERLYSELHPEKQKLSDRIRCIEDLKSIGYQTGVGFMVGAPGQTLEDICEDFEFMRKVNPHMIGIGPFISHEKTPFANEKNGSLDLTVRIIALARLIIRRALIPSTTALATLDKAGREKGLRAGANVVMPNLTPSKSRSKYELYKDKASTGIESAEGLEELKRSIAEMGYKVVTDRGDAC